MVGFTRLGFESAMRAPSSVTAVIVLELFVNLHSLKLLGCLPVYFPTSYLPALHYLTLATCLRCISYADKKGFVTPSSFQGHNTLFFFPFLPYFHQHTLNPTNDGNN